MLCITSKRELEAIVSEKSDKNTMEQGHGICPLGTVAWSSACKAFYNRWSVEVEKIIPSLSGIIVPGNEIFDNGHMWEFSAPAPPLTDTTEWPAKLHWHPLAAPTAKRMCAIRDWIDFDIEKIVSKHLQKVLSCLWKVIGSQSEGRKQVVDTV